MLASEEEESIEGPCKAVKRECLRLHTRMNGLCRPYIKGAILGELEGQGQGPDTSFSRPCRSPKPTSNVACEP